MNTVGIENTGTLRHLGVRMCNVSRFFYVWIDKVFLFFLKLLILFKEFC